MNFELAEVKTNCMNGGLFFGRCSVLRPFGTARASVSKCWEVSAT